MTLKLCNVCGKPLIRPNDCCGSIHLHTKFEYGTDYDGQTLDADICGECIKEYLPKVRKVFKFDPII